MEGIYLPEMHIDFKNLNKAQKKPKSQNDKIAINSIYPNQGKIVVT